MALSIKPGGAGFGMPASPVLQGVQAASGALDSVTTDKGERQANPKYKGIRAYLVIIDKAARKESIPPAFQAAILAQENGGWSKWNPTAVSPAGAQGIAQFMPRTWATYGKGGNPLNPTDAIEAQARFLKSLLKQSTGGRNLTEAAKGYYGGPGSMRRNSDAPEAGGAPSLNAYAASVRKYYDEITQDGFFKGGVDFDPLKPLDAAGEAVNSVADFVKLIASPKGLGTLWGKATAFFIKSSGTAVWHYVVAPPWHWTQRATVYYFEDIMSGKAGSGYYYNYAALVTAGFWSIGYGILWAKIEEGPGLAARSRETPLGRAAITATNLGNRRALIKPSKVEANTKASPDPVKSEVPVAAVRTISVNRRRAVKVSGVKEGSSNGTTNADANAADNATQQS